jgi:hypothetical protein
VVTVRQDDAPKYEPTGSGENLRRLFVATQVTEPAAPQASAIENPLLRTARVPKLASTTSGRAEIDRDRHQRNRLVILQVDRDRTEAARELKRRLLESPAARRRSDGLVRDPA